jgi:inorganic pyrophosphatase
MNTEKAKKLVELLGKKFKAHPWHGISAGDKTPELVNAFIEIDPTTTIKYEIDKKSGYIMVDRPQKFSNNMPCLYGFIPKTFCAEEIAEFCMQKTGKTDVVGDGDPLDICVITERHIPQGDILVPCIPIGGFRMIDDGEADDKIIAVLKGDEVYGDWDDVSKVPSRIIDRMEHYFLSYKNIPGKSKAKVEITHTYGREEALEVVRRSMNDYTKKYGDVDQQLADLLSE